MSFVTLGGDGSARPTFFELVAAERLMPSLKAAVAYSLSVSWLKEAMFSLMYFALSYAEPAISLLE